MGNLHLVTGFAGKAHVAAADHASLFEAAIRSGQYVLSAGERFAASVVSNNQIRIADGELIMQGRHVKLDPGSYADLAIENGAQGYLRNDMIVARYTCDAATGIEDCNLVVIKGIQAESNPTDPAYTVGNINSDGAMQNDMPLYRVPLDGLNVGELQAFFVPQESLHDNTRLDPTLSQANKAADAAAVGAALAGKAPAGYGLGIGSVYSLKAIYSEEEAKAISETGWYGYHGPALATGCNIGIIRAEITSGAYKVLHFTDLNGYRLVNTLVYDVWTGWEWENSPMVPGVEYRTTERVSGKPVYCQAVAFDAFPDAYSTVAVPFDHVGKTILEINLSGYATWNGYNPWNWVAVEGQKEKINIINDGPTSLTGVTTDCYVLVKYIKNDLTHNQ